MNQFLCKSLLLLAGMCILVPGGNALLAQEKTADLNVSRTYAVKRDMHLDVQNKYGKIDVLNWERDSVFIQVHIHLSESSESKLRKLKQDVSIDFKRSPEKISAHSTFKSESRRLASELKSVGHTITGSNKHVEINYTVYVPAYLKIALDNKFGDVYMDRHQGQVNITLSNGVLKTGRLEGVSTLELSFANGMIESLGSSTLRLSYSDISLGDAGQLDLNSKSSKLKADSVNVLKMNSRRDKLHFQRVEYFYGNSNFTEVWIYDFLRESDVYMRYGKLTMEHVLPGFSKIYVESDYTDISLYFNEQSAFRYDILHHMKSSLRLPSEVGTKEQGLEGKDHVRTQGSWGQGQGSSQVTIDALQKCYVNISIK